MTQKDKDLLLKDLCARLPYGVIVETTWAEQLTDVSGTIGTLKGTQIELFEDGDYSEIIPYLRPMSSMTEEEKEELYEVSGLICYDGLFTCKKLAKKQSFIADTTDWLNAHHFDYRGLIENGLALEAPEGMYKIE